MSSRSTNCYQLPFPWTRSPLLRRPKTRQQPLARRVPSVLSRRRGRCEPELDAAAASSLLKPHEGLAATGRCGWPCWRKFLRDTRLDQARERILRSSSRPRPVTGARRRRVGRGRRHGAQAPACSEANVDVETEPASVSDHRWGGRHSSGLPLHDGMGRIATEPHSTNHAGRPAARLPPGR